MGVEPWVIVENCIKSVFSIMSFSSNVIRRCLSTTNSVSQMVKTPIPLFGTAGAYCEALYSAASKNENKECVANDLKVFGNLLKNRTVSDYMTDPFINSADKLGVLNEAAGSDMIDTSVNFFALLAENNRLDMLGEVNEMFDRLLSAERGEVPVSITTAQPLTEAQRSDVVEAVTKFLKEGQQAVLEEKIDADILGGMVVGIGDKFTDMKYIDMSTSSKLKMYIDLIKQPL